MTVVPETGLDAGEGRRLRELRAACPAFFAARGTRRRQLDWLHRRRAILDDAPACTQVTG